MLVIESYIITLNRPFDAHDRPLRGSRDFWPKIGLLKAKSPKFLPRGLCPRTPGPRRLGERLAICSPGREAEGRLAICSDFAPGRTFSVLTPKCPAFSQPPPYAQERQSAHSRAETGVASGRDLREKMPCEAMPWKMLSVADR